MRGVRTRCRRAAASGQARRAGCSSRAPPRSAARLARRRAFHRQQRLALVVERPAIGLHVVEPDVVGAAGVGLGEEQDGGGDTGVGPEGAAGQRDNGVQLLLFDEHAAQLLVRLAGAEEHAVRHDDRRAAARLEQTQEERQEEQLGLLGLDHSLEILGDVLVVERSGKGRIGQHQGVLLILAGVVLRERVAALDVGVLDAVQQHVHAADAEHGAVVLKAVEEPVMEVLVQLGVGEELGDVLAQVFARDHQEAAGAGGGVAPSHPSAWARSSPP